MARTTVIHHIPRHKGWPNGEPQSVRDAYDAQLAEESKKQGESKDSGK